MDLSQYKKAFISVLTIVVTVGPWVAQAAGMISVPTAAVISTLVGIAGSILHVLVPNTTTDPQVAQTQSVVLKTAA